MPAGSVGERALNGEWEYISNKCFELEEDMVMTFEGSSCNITDREGNPVPAGELGKDNGQVVKNVLAGYRCYVMRARVKFVKNA